MELKEVITARRSIRKFKDEPISDDIINEIIETGRLAPSGSNLQPARYVIVKSKEAREKLKECTPLNFVYQAPLVIACCIDTTCLNTYGMRYNELREAGAFAGTIFEKGNASDLTKRINSMPESEFIAYLKFNAAIAIDHITLRISDLGLGTCWIGMFDREMARKALELEERYQVVTLLPVGYPAHSPAPRPRIPINEVIIKVI